MPVRKKSIKPRADRPYMPGYEMMFRKNKKRSSWQMASERLIASRNYLFGTVRPDGRPHMMPIWGIWLDNSFYFSTGAKSRKARNLARTKNCIVCAEGLERAVIVEGKVMGKFGPSHPSFVRIARAYKKKYHWKLDGSEGPLFQVRPRLVFVMVEDGSSNPTRWSFG